MNVISWTVSLPSAFPRVELNEIQLMQRNEPARLVTSFVFNSLRLCRLALVPFALPFGKASSRGTSFTLSFCFHSLTLQFVLFKHSYRVLSANHLPPSIRSNLHSVTFVYSFQFKLHYFRLIIITVRLLANNIKLMFHYPKGIVSNYCYNIRQCVCHSINFN